MSNEILADIRRLYHHVVHGGQWDSKIDTKRLGKAIEEIERLTNELAMEEECYEELRADRDEWERLWKKASMSVIDLQDRVKVLEEDSDDNTYHN